MNIPQESCGGISGKVAVVTGAAGQLGTCLCSSFLKAGATVVGIDTRKPSFEKSGVRYIRCDIRSQAMVKKRFKDIARAYGRIDILVNNAGVSVFEPFEKRDEKKFEWVMDVNLKGTFYCIQAYVACFDARPQARGAIVNVGSVYGVVSPDFRIYVDGDRKNSEVYGATKAGVIQMTRYFAVHLAQRNIRVNAVSPGGIFNPRIPQRKSFIRNYSQRCPMGRMGKEHEIVGAVMYFAGDGASYTTGQNLVVDGGFSCW
jgi:NAD(P)-dependent dehydrogenase (short-subunit alcohol dehydrogenase family)